MFDIFVWFLYKYIYRNYFIWSLEHYLLVCIPILIQAANISSSSSSPSLTCSSFSLLSELFIVILSISVSSLWTSFSSSSGTLSNLWYIFVSLGILTSSSIVRELRLVALENSIGVDSSLKVAISSSKTLFIVICGLENAATDIKFRRNLYIIIVTLVINNIINDINNNVHKCCRIDGLTASSCSFDANSAFWVLWLRGLGKAVCVGESGSSLGETIPLVLRLRK